MNVRKNPKTEFAEQFGIFFEKQFPMLIEKWERARKKK